MKRLFLLTILLFLTTAFSFSVDFGLVADQKFEAENDLLTYTPGLAPWFSWNNGTGLSVYLSGIFSFKYRNYHGDMPGENGWTIIPEFSRFALSYRINQAVSFEAGRIGYTDVLGFAASGLFDGLRLKLATSAGDLSAGVLYSGLLYKETAKILMTAEDMAKYARPWKWNSFDEYAASRRLLTAVRWDMPVGEANNLSTEVLAQFDLNGNSETFHSQYGALMMDFFPKSSVKISAGALFEAMENSGDFNAAFSALAQLKVELPTKINDLLGFTAKFTSGAMNQTFSSFSPISSFPQGAVFTGTLGGLALIETDYRVRIINSLSVESALRYFIKTYTTCGNLYGGEIWAYAAWQPLEDIRASLGGGVFIPALGNADPSGAVMWKVAACLTISL